MKHKRDFKALRQDFPIFNSNDLIYFDSAATAQKPQIVIDAIKNFYEQHYGTVHRTVYDLSIDATTLYESARHKVQKLLNAKKTEEIIFTKETTESINLVANSFGQLLSEGDEIIISEVEHHSNIVPWQLLCMLRKVKLRIVPVNDQSEINLEAYSNLLSHKTKLVSFAHISNVTGTVNPIKKLIAMAHEKGAKAFIDGAQSVPHMPVDVQDLDADFYAFSGHKFYGPTGVGVLYGKEEILKKMPPHYGGGDMVGTVSFEGTSYNELPLKFEAGTPHISGVIGLGAAIDYISGIGLEAIQKWESELLTYATNELLKIEGLKVIGNAPDKGALVTFVVDGVHPLDLGTLLNLHRIAIRTGNHCAQTALKRFGLASACRISFAFYNTKSEIDEFMNYLKQTIKNIKGC